MNLEMIAAKLVADAVGVVGTTIFINHMPVKAKSGILLRPPYVGTPIDYELPGYRRTRFNMSCRAESYTAAKALIEAAIASATVKETTLSGISVKYVRPTTEPVSFPISDGGFVEFLVIFEAVYVIVG